MLVPVYVTGRVSPYFGVSIQAMTFLLSLSCQNQPKIDAMTAEVSPTGSQTQEKES